MFTSFHNYTEEMYKGNEPSYISKGICDGCYCWQTERGNAYTTQNGELMACGFSVRPKTTVYILGDELKIMKLNAKHETSYLFSSKLNVIDSGMKEMSSDMIEGVINTKIPDCKIWKIIQRRAKEIYEKYVEDTTAFYKKE